MRFFRVYLLILHIFYEKQCNFRTESLVKGKKNVRILVPRYFNIFLALVVYRNPISSFHSFVQMEFSLIRLFILHTLIIRIPSYSVVNCNCSRTNTFTMFPQQHLSSVFNTNGRTSPRHVRLYLPRFHLPRCACTIVSFNFQLKIRLCCTVKFQFPYRAQCSR